MGLAGGISSWAWREHVKILKIRQDIEHKKLIRNQENSAYLEELKRKLTEQSLTNKKEREEKYREEMLKEISDRNGF